MSIGPRLQTADSQHEQALNKRRFFYCHFAQSCQLVPIKRRANLEILLLLILVCAAAVFVYLLRGDQERQDRSGHVSSEEIAETWVRPVAAARALKQQSQPVMQGAAFVVDGDTLVISQTQIRLFGIDAPELNHPYGKNAKRALMSLCGGEVVRAEITDRDAHGRMVAKCYVTDGRDLSAEMVKLGLAIDWPKFSGGLYGALEVTGIRKRLWLADARQKGRMHVWEQFEARQGSGASRE